ncbi:MAG: hypothetical protein AB1814_12375 [Thermodesulfobacteriota bacterium]
MKRYFHLPSYILQPDKETDAMVEIIYSTVVDILQYISRIDTEYSNWCVGLTKDSQKHESRGNENFRVFRSRNPREAKEDLQALIKMGFREDANSDEDSSVWLFVYKIPGRIFS